MIKTPRGKRTILFIQNKIDKKEKCKNKDTFFISCKNKIGIKKLFTKLLTIVEKHKRSFLHINSKVISNNFGKNASGGNFPLCFLSKKV